MHACVRVCVLLAIISFCEFFTESLFDVHRFLSQVHVWLFQWASWFYFLVPLDWRSTKATEINEWKPSLRQEWKHVAANVLCSSGSCVTLTHTIYRHSHITRFYVYRSYQILVPPMLFWVYFLTARMIMWSWLKSYWTWEYQPKAWLQSRKEML